MCRARAVLRSRMTGPYPEVTYKLVEETGTKNSFKPQEQGVQEDVNRQGSISVSTQPGALFVFLNLPVITLSNSRPPWRRGKVGATCDVFVIPAHPHHCFSRP